MGYIGMCGPKWYGFSAVLVINWVSILAILPPFLPVLFRGSYFFITPSSSHPRFSFLYSVERLLRSLVDKASNKSRSPNNLRVRS